MKLTSESLSEIASAYSIKALDSRISSLEGGSAMNVSVSGSGNAVTAISKSGTTIIVTKGTTFLTSHQSLASYLTRTDAASLYQPKGNYLTAHQSLDGYVNAITTSGSGNAITSVSKSGKGITFTKGATFLTSHQSLANYYTKSSVDSLLSGKSATSHTHSVKINGVTKTIAATGGTAVDLGTYLTSHQSLADYAKKTDIPTSLKSPNSLSWSGYNTGSYDGSSPKSFVIPSNTNQLTNGAGFITSSASISGNAATATKVNHSLLVFGKSFNGSADVTVADTDLIASISTGTSNVTDKTEILTSYASDNGFNDSNAKNKIHRRPASAIWGYINSKTISNADKLDNVHLNGIFTALSNTNNGVSMTIGTVAKSLANMQVYSATKLVTARNISIAGRDFVGNVNFDGTGNVSLNGAINYCTINIGNTDPNPFKRIAHIKVARSWNDNALLLYISQGYHGGNFGLCRVEFRTNDIANSDTAGGGVSLRWLIRQGYATDSIQAGYYIHLKNAYVDVFLKTTGAYQGTVIRVIQDSRGSINNSFGLINSTYNTEAYTSLSAAATALYNVAYQGTVSGTDTCTVSHANSATKLQTPRTIWGQSFDGTGNVNGTLRIKDTTSNYREGIRIQNPDNTWCTIALGGTSNEGTGTNCWSIHRKSDNNFCISRNSSDGANGLVMTSTGMGLGTTAPAYRLDVRGDIYSSDRVIANNSVLSNKLYSSTTPNNTENKCIEIAGNTIREYHSGANPYHSAIILNYDSLSFSAYGTIDITANQGGITLDTGGSIKLSSANGFNITYRGAHFSVSQTNGSEYTWSMDSIKAKGNILATGGITAYSSSDIRLKQDLRKLDYFGIIKAMGGTFGFAWKKDNTRSIGWIAQHVLCNPHLKDIVETDEKGYYKINYWSPKLIATAFGAIEQVGDEVSRLKARVVFLESEVQRLSGDKEDCNKKRLDNKNINSLN